MVIEAREFLKYFSGNEPPEESVEALARMTNPRYLPSFDEVVSSFSFESDFERILSDWKQFLLGHIEYSVYECFTKEYIEGLSNYLSNRISEIHEKNGEKVTILDVCSGNGRLPYFLNEKLIALNPPETFEILAVDDKHSGWDTKREECVYNVLDMTCEEGLERFNPQIVLASWMPGEYAPHAEEKYDWPSLFRKNPSVEEYILIGRDYWGEYHGEPKFRIPSTFVPGYTLEGFRRVDHENLSRFQICHEDGPEVKYHDSVSTTASFIRIS